MGWAQLNLAGQVKQVAICTQIGVPVETYGKFPSYLGGLGYCNSRF